MSSPDDRTVDEAVGAAADRTIGHASDETSTTAGSEPDPRFLLANERTFLAWNRTSLALIGGGVAVSELIKGGDRATRLVAALVLIAFGGYVALNSYLHFERSRRALDRGQPLPDSALPRTATYGVVAFAVAAVVLVTVQFA
jgi:putative membrane protein